MYYIALNNQFITSFCIKLFQAISQENKCHLLANLDNWILANISVFIKLVPKYKISLFACFLCHFRRQDGLSLKPFLPQHLR
jgi:hypothetical protein